MRAYGLPWGSNIPSLTLHSCLPHMETQGGWFLHYTLCFWKPLIKGYMWWKFGTWIFISLILKTVLTYVGTPYGLTSNMSLKILIIN